MIQAKARPTNRSTALILSALKNFGAMRIGLNLSRDFQMNRDWVLSQDSMTNCGQPSTQCAEIERESYL